jgi:hypothetical protein
MPWEDAKTVKHKTQEVSWGYIVVWTLTMSLSLPIFQNGTNPKSIHSRLSLQVINSCRKDLCGGKILTAGVVGGLGW